jgi:hypothetical protein
MLDYRDLRRSDDSLARWKDDADREAVRMQDCSDIEHALEQQANAAAQMAELQAEVEALKAHCEERLREIAETVIETVDSLRDSIENLHAKSSTVREQVANAASREELDRRLESERSARASAITDAVAKCHEQLARNEQRSMTSEQQMFAAIVSRFLGHGVAVKVPMLRGTYDPRTTYSALDVIAKVAESTLPSRTRPVCVQVKRTLFQNVLGSRNDMTTAPREPARKAAASRRRARF